LSAANAAQESAHVKATSAARRPARRLAIMAMAPDGQRMNIIRFPTNHVEFMSRQLGNRHLIADDFSKI
jgi:hypothetical protein